jgi:predicted Rdx family selenoprotein
MERAPRATWIQTELFLTFPTPAIKSIALIPLNTPETGGRFRVWLDKGEGGSELLWDRKVCPSFFAGACSAWVGELGCWS